MEITGKIVQTLPKQTGNAKNGTTWEKQEYIIEVPGQYPKKVCFNLWGDKIAKFGIQDGQDLTISVDVESREYNGRWYTDIRAWNVTKQNAGSANGGTNSAPSFDAMPAGDQGSNSAASNPFEDDDLPF
jgi:hypothetical protein